MTNIMNLQIICLQEVQQTHLEEFYKPHLEAMGMQCIVVLILFCH